MRIVRDIVRYFFEKNAPAVTPTDAEWRNRTRYNAIHALDPDVLVRHLNAFNQGDIAGLERIVEEFEQREDKMKIGAFKMAAAVAGKPWEVRIVKGEEDNPRARLHQEVLTKFWNRIEVTDAFCRNRRGGLRLLVKNMMGAQSRVYDVHDVAWHVNGDGSLKATFTHVPAWSFENRSGRLRHIRNDGQYEGEQMRDGEWLVTVGEGVGITATILAMAKRLSWNDWLLFSERCGMPVVMGNTSAQLGSDAWNALKRAIQAVAPKTGILADTGTQLSTVALSSGGQTTYNDLIGVVDRSISALYRGGDLATMSQGDSVGATSQDGESELMDADGARMVAETLRDQIERHVVRFTCGDFEPLAEIVIDPPVEAEDVERDIRIDNHLAGLGVRLSKADALARYGRAEATDDADALTLQTPMQTPFNGLANEEPPVARIVPNPQPGEPPDTSSKAVLEAFIEDATPAAEAVRKLMEDPTAEAAEELMERLPDLIGDQALAAVIAEAMAEEMAKAIGEAALENEVERVPSGNGNGGQFTGKTNQPDGLTKPKATQQEIDSFKKDLPKRISPEQADALLSAGFSDTDADGNTVRYGELLRDHLDRDSHTEQDRNARKGRLGVAVKMVRSSKPVPTGDAKPDERVYFGIVDGKAYVAVADAHNEIGAIEMVSYRRDGRRDER